MTLNIFPLQSEMGSQYVSTSQDCSQNHFNDPQLGRTQKTTIVVCGYVFSRVQPFVTPWTDCNLPGSSVYGILQARILEWFAISYARASSQPRDRTRLSCVSCTGKWILYHLGSPLKGYTGQQMNQPGLFTALWVNLKTVIDT